MRHIYKTTNMALIFTLIGAVLCSDPSYASSVSSYSLRVPLASQDPAFKKRRDPDWVRKAERHDEILRSDNPNRRITRFDPVSVEIGDGVIKTYISKLMESGEKFIVVTSPHVAQQMKDWGFPYKDELLKHAIYVDTVHYDDVLRFYNEAKEKAIKPQRIIGIGMGSVTDWAKIIGHKLDVEVDILPSAISTNAMFAANVAIRDGKGDDFYVYPYGKIEAPRHVIIDLDFAQLNKRGNIAGTGDLFSSWVALRDWDLAVEKGQEREDRPIYERTRRVLERLNEHATDIAKNNKKGIRVLAELGRDVSSLMSQFRSGRPKAGSEHILSDTIEKETQGRKILHGEQVAVATLLMAYLYELDYKALYKMVKATGLPLSLDVIGLTEQDLINALINAEPREGRFSYFDVNKVTEKKAKEAVEAIFGKKPTPLLSLNDLKRESRKITDKLFEDFGIVNIEDYSILYENIYYFIYHLQKIIGKSLTPDDYEFLLSMLALEDELATIGQMVKAAGGSKVSSPEREMYSNVGSEILGQVDRWIDWEHIETKMDPVYYKMFGGPGLRDVVVYFFLRIYFHISHSYTDQQHFENLALIARELKRGVNEIQVKYPEEFYLESVAENVHLYGSARHTLGIGDLDVRIHHLTLWSQEKMGGKKLFDSEIIDVYSWPEERDISIKVPPVLLERHDLEFISFIYGVRTIQRFFMDQGISISISAIGEITERVWVDKQRLTSADLTKRIQVSEEQARLLATTINSFLFDEKLGGILTKPSNKVYGELVERLDEIRQWREKFRKDKNLSLEAEERLREIKREVIPKILDSPLFGVDERNYFKDRLASLQSGKKLTPGQTVISLAGLTTIGERIKALRELKGLTQEELAEKIGTLEAAISRWERGKNEPFPKQIPLLARELEVDAALIVLGKPLEVALAELTTGERIKALREIKGLTQEELAEKIGTVKATISKWERGENEPYPQNIQRLAKELKVSEALILTGNHNDLKKVRSRPISTSL